METELEKKTERKGAREGKRNRDPHISSSGIPKNTKLEVVVYIQRAVFPPHLLQASLSSEGSSKAGYQYQKE